MKSHILYLLIGVCLLIACEKEEEVHPKIETLEAIPTSAYSCVFKGSIITQGNSPVLDYGFIYSSDSYLSLQTGTKISLGKDIIASAFEKEVSDLIVNNYERKLFVRSYFTNQRGTVYGSVLPFTLPAVSVQNVIPAAGKTGDLITITGNNFITNSNSLEVKFNNTNAKIVEVTADKLVVEVPSTVNSFSTFNNAIPIYLFMGGEVITVLTNFRLIPAILDFSPKSGTFGTTITITGENLPANAYYSEITVSVGDVNVPVSQMTFNTMTVSIPSNITSERLKVTVTTAGQATELPGEFTVVPPRITAVSPGTGLTGSSVTITGTNFNLSSYNYTINTVRFGTIQATVTHTMPGNITVEVPLSLSPGAYPLTVFTGVHTVTALENFVVVAPSISSFTPTIGTAGTEVVIYGNFHPYTYNYNSPSVKFGTTPATIIQATTTSLRAIVPTYIPAGKTKISVTSAGQTVIATEDFEIPTVTLTGFTPASATPGTRITIFGSGFSLDKFYNVVKFGTYETTIIEASPNSLVVQVPSSVNLGAMKISVQVHGQIVTSTEDFIVVNQ